MTSNASANAVRTAVLLLLCLGWSCSPQRPNRADRGTQANTAYQHVAIGLGEDYAREARTPANLRRDLELMKSSGLHVLRVSFPWAEIEPEQGRYDWEFWDSLVALATDTYHIRILPYVCYTPRWAALEQTEDFWRQPPKDAGAFAGFVELLAARYRGRVESWEIWNEPDNPEFWRGTPEQFAQLLEAGTRAVREADPQARVIMGGLAWNLRFLESMLDTPAVRGIDVVNLHNYNETWARDPLERITDYVGQASDLLLGRGLRLPIWTAEIGYSSQRQQAQVSNDARAFYRYEHTPEHQAASLFRAMTLLLASGKVSLITWYRINDLNGSQEVIGDGNNRSLGVVDQSGRPKPALKALSNFQSLFGNGFMPVDDQVRVAKRIRSAAEVHAFARPDGTVVIASWLRTVVPGERGSLRAGDLHDRRQESVDLTLPFGTAKSAELFDELGNLRGHIRISTQDSGARVRGLKLRGGEVVVLIADKTQPGQLPPRQTADGE